MPPRADDRVLPVEAQVDRRCDPSIRTHRVPHAAEMHLHRPRKRILKRVLRRNRRLLPGLRLLSVHPQNVRNQLFVPRFQQSVHMQQAAHRPRRIRPAAEPEQENVVAILIGVHQVAISVAHVVQQPLADRQPLHLRPPFRQVTTHIRRSQRAQARVVISDLPIANFQRVVQLHHIRICLGLVEIIPRTVAANHDVLRHSSPRAFLNCRWLRLQDGAHILAPANTIRKRFRAPRNR